MNKLVPIILLFFFLIPATFAVRLCDITEIDDYNMSVETKEEIKKECFMFQLNYTSDKNLEDRKFFRALLSIATSGVIATMIFGILSKTGKIDKLEIKILDSEFKIEGGSHVIAWIALFGIVSFFMFLLLITQ